MGIITSILSKIIKKRDIRRKTVIKAKDNEGNEYPTESLEIRAKYSDGRTQTFEAIDAEQSSKIRPKNKELIHIWRCEEFDLVFKPSFGQFFLSFHGGKHFFRVELEDHDINQLYAAMEYAYAYRNRIYFSSHLAARRAYIPPAIHSRMREINDRISRLRNRRISGPDNDADMAVQGLKERPKEP